MIFIGESINSSITRIEEAVAQKDGDYIRRLARAQKEAGAHYLDVNCGNQVGKEPEIMQWLVEQIQQEVDLPLSIDSPGQEAMETGLRLSEVPKPIMNSITAEKARFEAFAPLISSYDTKVIALLMDDGGMPEDASDRIRIARDLVPRLQELGTSPDDIIVDPIVKPIGTGDTSGTEVFESIRTIREDFPDVHISVGLSNISHGMPMDAEINHSFLVMCIQNGLDYCIANVLDSRIIGYAACAEALAGRDPFCGHLLKQYRKGIFPGKTDYLDI